MSLVFPFLPLKWSLMVTVWCRGVIVEPFLLPSQNHCLFFLSSAVVDHGKGGSFSSYKASTTALFGLFWLVHVNYAYCISFFWMEWGELTTQPSIPNFSRSTSRYFASGRSFLRLRTPSTSGSQWRKHLFQTDGKLSLRRGEKEGVLTIFWPILLLCCRWWRRHERMHPTDNDRSTSHSSSS